MRDFAIRPAVLADTAGAETLLAELGYPIGDENARLRAERILTARKVYTLVACAGDSVLGLISGQFLEMFPYRALFVTVLVVHPEARRRGVGRALLEAMNELGRDHECACIMGISRADLPENLAYYSKLGYRSSGIRFLKSF